MKKILFTMFALLLTAATGTWAQSLYVAEITADMVAGWENDETDLPTTDLPGFKPATYEEVSAWTGAPTSGHTYLFYNHGDGGYGCFEYQDGVKSQEGTDNSQRKHIYYRIINDGDKVYYTCSYDPNGPDFNLNGTLDHGTIAFTVYGNEATTAKEGQTVTVTVTADEGYTVQSITGEWSTTFGAAHSRRRTPALTTIPVLGDIALTPVDGQENTWTFTMEAANATFSATLAAIPYTVIMAKDTEDAGNWTIDPAEAKTTGVAKGTEITATYSGTKMVKSVKAVKIVPAATVTTAPTGAPVVAVGKTTALVSGGEADGGTLMYAVTTTYTQPTSTAGFSASVPTAQTITASGKVYVWYYVKADDTHTDSEIAVTEVPVADIVWDATNVSDIRVMGTYQSYEKEGVTLSGNAEQVQVQWYDLGHPEWDGMGFEVHESGGFTFTAPAGKAFTKIEMKALGENGWFEAYLGTGWALPWDNPTTITWTDSAASTVGLLTDANNFNGAYISYIAFYLSE